MTDGSKTNNQKYFLKPNVVLEPLVGKWYAWSHLISPATAAMNVSSRHLKIMDSYIQAPQVHATAVKNPKMLGGPFVDYQGMYVNEIRALRDATLVSQKDLLQLTASIHQLNKLLKNQARGASLQPLYDSVPEALKGFVELVYDLRHQPSFRLFESLLYSSAYYKPALQSIALWLTHNDDRPFVLSTPRIQQPHVIQRDVPFHDTRIDAIAAMKRNGGSKGRIRDFLNIEAKEEALFDSFFTTLPPPRYERYAGDNIRMRYFGHACILIETKDVSILLDPVVSYYGYDQQVERFSDMDLPEMIDYVLITHNHQDHILLETLLPLRHKIRNIVLPRGGNGSLQDPSLKLMFRRLGFGNIFEVSELEEIAFHDCVITGVPFIGEHADLDIPTKICYHLRVDGFTMLFMADSSNVQPDVYRLVERALGKVDVIFLGMECEGAPLSWLYGPLLSEPITKDNDESRRLSGSDFEKGKSLVEIFRPLELYIYAMGQEPWLKFISSIKYTPESHPIVQSDKLISFCLEKGIVAERLFGEKEILYGKKQKTVVGVPS